jgi:IclR family pca regulon transcriptional regulator
MGRILLAGLSETELESYLETVTLERLTQRSLGSPEKLREEIELARSRGWAMVSQELEDGLRGVAVPVRSGDKTLAAVNVSLQTHRAPADTIEKTVVPQLQDAARQIGQDYGVRAS